QLEEGGEIHAPGKQPDEVKQPEVKPRHCVVIAWVAQVQEPQHLLVHKVKPQEAVVLAGKTAQREVEIWRILQGRQDVPGRGDEQDDSHSREEMQPLPGSRHEQLPSDKQVYSAGSDRKEHANQALQQ